MADRDRHKLDAIAGEAPSLRSGDAGQSLESVESDEALSRTFETMPAVEPAADLRRKVPHERPGQYTRVGELGRNGQSVVHLAVVTAVLPAVLVLAQRGRAIVRE